MASKFTEKKMLKSDRIRGRIQLLYKGNKTGWIRSGR